MGVTVTWEYAVARERIWRTSVSATRSTKAEPGPSNACRGSGVHGSVDGDGVNGRPKVKRFIIARYGPRAGCLWCPSRTVLPLPEMHRLLKLVRTQS